MRQVIVSPRPVSEFVMFKTPAMPVIMLSEGNLLISSAYEPGETVGGFPSITAPMKRQINHVPGQPFTVTTAHCTIHYVMLY